MWIRLEDTIWEDGKTSALYQELALASMHEAVGIVAALLHWAVRQRDPGDLSKFSNLQIWIGARMSGSKIEPDIFVEALMLAGFFTRERQLENLAKYQGQLIDRNESQRAQARERQRRHRLRTDCSAPASDARGRSDALSRDVSRVTSRVTEAPTLRHDTDLSASSSSRVAEEEEIYSENSEQSFEEGPETVPAAPAAPVAQSFSEKVLACQPARIGRASAGWEAWEAAAGQSLWPGQEVVEQIDLAVRLYGAEMVTAAARLFLRDSKIRQHTAQTFCTARVMADFLKRAEMARAKTRPAASAMQLASCRQCGQPALNLETMLCYRCEHHIEVAVEGNAKRRRLGLGLGIA